MLSMFALISLILVSGSIYGQDDLIFTKAWVRDTPPGAPNGAAYFEITNRGQLADRLMGVASDAAERAEMHTHLHQDGMMQMRQVEVIEIPAGGQARFEPGGNHVMLINLRQVLKQGDTITLQLKFDKAGTVQINLPVQREAPE